MHLTSLIISYGFMWLPVFGFEGVTIYEDVHGCDATDDTHYRILSGPSQGTCYTFDQPMPDLDCV
ncbi:hypothetical protein K491DRAFT_722665 [Lophiostoma macrostomum CBS 122681]|uniref:Uncharacterized protein n=1 Tax=Lophiostoma macrostomum CBS 122681 TaxID=1314788 RepID=A0A6A6SMX1_9PLEO|nr:hypothetical protein K491DRAFT_722665 [Lophiostoma macrostomum CBS 122681]